jgi:hypothetical protein
VAFAGVQLSRETLARLLPKSSSRFRILYSHHPMDDAEDLFAMAFEQFSKGNSCSPTLSGCYQLLLDPGSKIADLRGIVVRR